MAVRCVCWGSGTRPSEWRGRSRAVWIALEMTMATDEAFWDKIADKYAADSAKPKA